MLIFFCSLFNLCTLPDGKIQAGVVLYREELCTNALLRPCFFYAHGHPEEDCQQKLTGARRASREKELYLLDHEFDI